MIKHFMAVYYFIILNSLKTIVMKKYNIKFMSGSIGKKMQTKLKIWGYQINNELVKAFEGNIL